MVMVCFNAVGLNAEGTDYQHLCIYNGYHMKTLVNKLGVKKTVAICLATIFVCFGLTAILPVDSPATTAFFILGSLGFGLWGLVIVFFKEDPMLPTFLGKGLFALISGYIMMIGGWGLCLLIIYSVITKW